MSKLPDRPHVDISSAQMLWDWLEQNHAMSTGVLLITWKASNRAKYVSREEVLDGLVAYGWIDGRRYRMEGPKTAQLITPRKAQHWAQSYKDRAEALIAEGRMRPAGLASIEAGKQSGLWDFMADVDRLEVPSDLAEALGSHFAAWEALAPSYRRNVLRWIKLAKSSSTRINRLQKTVQSVARGEKLPQM